MRQRVRLTDRCEPTALTFRCFVDLRCINMVQGDDPVLGAIIESISHRDISSQAPDSPVLSLFG
jgi:hypothetical protein